MQAQVPEPQPSGARAGRTPSDDDALIRSFEAIADAFAVGDDLFDAGCLALAHQACHLLGWTRCSIFLKNAETGAYAGRLNYRTDGAAIDSRVARLTCATTADRFAQELIATRRPVLIRDARNDPRPVRAAMSRWRVRTILGVPLTAGDEVVGLLFLDDEDTLRDYDARRMDLSARFGRLAGIAVRHAARAAEHHALIEAGLRQTENLRQQLAVQDRLMALVRDGATIWDLARVAAALTGNPCAVQDAEGRVVALHRRPGALVPSTGILDEAQRRIPEVQTALAGLNPATPAMVGPVPTAGLMHRLLLTQISAGGRPWGTLVVMESGRRLTPMDRSTARLVANAMALHVEVERRTQTHHEHAREAMLREVLSRPPEAAPLTRQAKLLGLGTTGPHVVCVLADATGKPLPGLQWFQRRWAALGASRRSWATTLPHGKLAAVVELGAEQPSRAAMAAVRGELERLLRSSSDGRSILIGLSSVCSGPKDYRRCFEEAGQVLGVLRTIRGDRGPKLLAVDDLGAAGLLLASVDPGQVERFVASSVAPLLAEGAPRDLLPTLQAFSEASNQLRAAARRLGVHENTVRNRLRRVVELTGLDVTADPNAQLSVQVALLMLRLQGKLEDP